MKKLIIQQPYIYIYIYIERISLHSLVSQNIDCGGVAVHVVAPLSGVSFLLLSRRVTM